MGNVRNLTLQLNQANEDKIASEAHVRDQLRQASQMNRTLQEQLANLTSRNAPPSKAEIANRGGIVLAVEDDNDVWCLIKNADDMFTSESTPNSSNSKSHWWLMSQLDV